MKNKWMKLAGITMAMAGLSMAVQATSITGSVAFNGTATVNNSPLSAATAFSTVNAFVAANQQVGTYTALANGLSVNFTPFTWNPVGGVTPLWTVTVSGITYSFDATSMTATYVSIAQEWVFGGTGTAHVTNLADTAGTWNANTGVQGTSFFFGSASAVNTPDGGATVMLLGAALSAMGLLRRKLIA